MRRGWIISCLALGCLVEARLADEPVGDSATTQARDTDPSLDPSSTDAGEPSEGSSTGGPPPFTCPEPPAQSTVDGLVHVARGTGDTFIEILDLQARDNIVYSCTATQGLTVWDLDNDPPSLLSEHVGPAGLAHVQFPRCQHFSLDPEGTRAVITNRGDEIQPQPWLFLYELADPAAPEPLRGWSGSASIEGAVIGGDRIYAAAHTSGVLVFEDQGGEELVQIGAFSDEDSDAWQPLLVGDRLYVAEGASGLRIYDVSNDDPVLLSTLALPGSSKDLELDGDTLYLAASSSILAVDVSDPSDPRVKTERPAKGTAVALALGGDNAVYVAEWDEIRVYDTASAALEQIWAEVVPTDDPVSRVLTVATNPSRDAVYAGEWTGMHAFETRPNPSAPDIVAAPTSLQFGTVQPGDFGDRVIVLRNEGDQPLHVYGAQPDHPSVTVNDACFEVEPHSAFAIEARFDPSDDAQTGGRIILSTNDPDEPQYAVRYVGNAAGADVGDPIPEFTLQDLNGNTWDSADLEGKVVLLAYFATF